MKTLITIILTILISTSYAQLYVRTYLLEDSTELNIQCSQQEVKSLITNKRVVFKSSAISLDLKIVKKRLGETKSWLGKSEDGTHYYITVRREGDSYGVLFQPCDEKLNRLPLPLVSISNYNVCE